MGMSEAILPRPQGLNSRGDRCLTVVGTEGIEAGATGIDRASDNTSINR